MTTPARRALLVAALGFLEAPFHGGPPAPVLALASWMHSWSGIGALVVGMHAQGYDVELKQLAEHWRANFYPSGVAHSIVKGTAWEPAAWRAVQRAAWAALNERRTA